MKPWYEVVNTLEARGEAYAIVTVLGARGSTPRDSGTKMVVSETESYCTIGGGHLEFKAIAEARRLLQDSSPQQKIEHFPLGAKLGQCCGGSATILFETFALTNLNIMLFGAGHVGKALISVLSQLPCRIHWVDNRDEEFPSDFPHNVRKCVSESPADEVSTMPANSYYIVMTHNHPLDFDITEKVLTRNDAAYIGLIGSQTKWQRFKMRFEHRQHTESFYQAVRCPVGLSAVPGKLPIEVAVSIAGEIIAEHHQTKPQKNTQQGVHWRDLKSMTERHDKPTSTSSTETHTGKITNTNAEDATP